VDRQCPSCGGFCKKSGCERENIKPKREWVGLTDEERKQIVSYINDPVAWVPAVEAKLKEKNT
jgi:predicted Fe-S protein YdhL (DUF1289 family)